MYNLDDEDVRDRLEQNGIILKVDHEAHFMVSENQSTGFGWMVDEASCFNEGLASYETAQGITHMESPNEGTLVGSEIEPRRS
jgi:hypothetical protein